MRPDVYEYAEENALSEMLFSGLYVAGLQPIATTKPPEGEAMKTKDKVPSGPMTKVLQVLTRAVEPSASQIDLIRPYLLRDFTPEELYIRQMMLANDQYDRSNERFDAGYLTRFAETVRGKSVLIGHEYGTAPVGRFFDSGLATDDQGWQWVSPWFYMPISPGNQLARDNIDSGVWSYVSIGAYVDYGGLICDICKAPYYPWYAAENEAYCPHIKGEEYDGRVCTCTWDSARSDMQTVEAVEGSIVYLGCQYEAAIAKDVGDRRQLTERKKEALAERIHSIGGDISMTPEEIKVLQEEANQAKTDLAMAQAEIQALTPMVEIGKLYIADLQAEILRIAKLCGEEQIASALTESVSDVTKLKEVLAEYKAKWDKISPPSGKAEILPVTEEEVKLSINPRQYSTI